MGVIQRQGIKQSLVNYFAVIIGAIATIFIYPLDTETYGVARFIIDAGAFFAPFILFGLNNVSIRFFPQFRNEGNHNGFLFFLVSSLVVTSILFVLLSFIFKEQLMGLYADKPSFYQQFLPYIIPVTILLAFISLFYYYSSNFQRIVVPSLYQSLIRLTLPVLVLLFILEKISLKFLINGILISYVISLIGIIIYISWLGQLKLKPDFSLFTIEKKKEIRVYALYGLIGSFGGMIALRIDSIMISTMLDFNNNGIYSIAAFIANVIAIPTNALMQISGPIVSESFKKDDLNHIEFLYKQTSINLLVFGLFLFVAITISINDLFSLMKNGEILKEGFMIVVLIGLAKIIDMATSINNHIINYSQYFRFNFYAIILISIFNIIANLIFIPLYGLTGVAIATLSALILYNLIKMIYVYRKFKIQPFSKNTIIVFIIAAICLLIGFFIPSSGNAILDILLRSLIIAILYGAAVFKLKVSEELNGMIQKTLNWKK